MGKRHPMYLFKVHFLYHGLPKKGDTIKSSDTMIER